MRQPPTAVPEAIVSAQTTMTHSAIPVPAFSMVCKNDSIGGRLSRWPALVAAKRNMAMMPIVFWASLVPCMKPIAPALKICALPKEPVDA